MVYKATHLVATAAIFITCNVAVAVAVAVAAEAEAEAAVKLGSLFQDHMVLQRGVAVPVWGQAEAGEQVTVNFAGQVKRAKASADGKWRVTLSSLDASAVGREMLISGEKGDAITLSDVVVGEVWVCSGQSNMAFRVGAVKEIRPLIKTQKHIRSFDVENTVSLKEESAVAGEWRSRGSNSAVAFTFSYFLQKELDVPVGIILTSWGSSSIEGWMPRDMTDELPHFKDIMNRFDSNEELGQDLEDILKKGKDRTPPEDIKLRTQPNIIYNAMMKPIIPFACRGIVWYQGEANAMNIEDMTQYGSSLPAWIERYRKEWGQEDFHFLGVMLPGFAKKSGKVIDGEDPSLISWAYMREAQLKALTLKNTGIVTTIDLGHVTDIHPKDKLPIGQRLALLAQRDVYGMDVLAEGPVLKEVTQEGAKLVVHYDHAEGLETKHGRPPRAFWVADDSQEWKLANAVVNEQTVVLSSPEIKKPLYVRYAFSAIPDVNLVNKAGLPARPFRTDQFTTK